MKKRTFTKQHRKNISTACKGRISWIKGKKMPKVALYKNMASHLRFDVSWKWLQKYEDIEKLKLLNDAITKRYNRFDISTSEYCLYIKKFYDDVQFNFIYREWLASDKEKYKKPSIDHIHPRTKGGTNKLDNLQFLSWFENRCKNDMSVSEWKEVKENIGDYFV